MLYVHSAFDDLSCDSYHWIQDYSLCNSYFSFLTNSVIPRFCETYWSHQANYNSHSYGLLGWHDGARIYSLASCNSLSRSTKAKQLHTTGSILEESHTKAHETPHKCWFCQSIWWRALTSYIQLMVGIKVLRIELTSDLLRPNGWWVHNGTLYSWIRRTWSKSSSHKYRSSVCLDHCS